LGKKSGRPANRKKKSRADRGGKKTPLKGNPKKKGVSTPWPSGGEENHPAGQGKKKEDLVFDRKKPKDKEKTGRKKGRSVRSRMFETVKKKKKMYRPGAGGKETRRTKRGESCSSFRKKKGGPCPGSKKGTEEKGSKKGATSIDMGRKLKKRLAAICRKREKKRTERKGPRRSSPAEKKSRFTTWEGGAFY